MYYFLNIGSNLGNRLLNISRAISAIEKDFGWFELSKTVESEPWGFDSTHKFINIGMLICSEREPLDVLRALQKIEKTISPGSHRKPNGEYADRVIDIDIMAAEDENKNQVCISTPELTLPHPHLQDRPFFLTPYQELKDL